MKLKLIFLTLFISTIQLTFAQVKFEAKVTKKKLGINEVLRVDFEMNKDGDDFTPPSFSGFKVSGPEQSIRSIWDNGKKSYSKTFSYFLQPTRKGNFTIKQATIKIDGKIYKTSLIKVTVTKAVAKSNGANGDFSIDDNVHLVTEVSKSNPYLNEAITVIYKLYVGRGLNISDLNVVDNPKYSDFWSQDIDVKRLVGESGTYKGEAYTYVVFHKTVLYPQKTGKLEIEPLALGFKVGVPTNRRDRFTGRRVFNQVDKMLVSSKRVINVKSLPLEGKPDDFSGAVGSFNFKVSTNKTNLDATESLDAKVLVSGGGNLKLFDLPKLNIPDGMEEYEPQHNERVRTNLTGMRGDISDTYTLVPQHKGNYSIPSVSFSYFDLKTKTYKTIESDEITIHVEKDPAVPYNDTSNVASQEGVSKKRVTQIGNQFRFLKSSADLQPIQKKYFFKSTIYWMSLVTPLLAIPLFLFFGKKRQQRLDDVSANRVRKADKLARKHLSEAKKNLGSQKEFYIAMERALHNYLKAKLNIQTSDMSKDRIQRLLKGREVEETVTIEFIALLESCEFARYTPSSTSAMQQDYDKASRVIATIDKQL
ncbi:BatD family protein [Aquimarina sp. I32.4]|uniref:BatD family protein n=1 Tax=Aquimarina sp. I32.4 TaxID=2053903 RepID=UPI000CDED11A|nr:BatD family protein [Aquimarina sp. I32.4]